MGILVRNKGLIAVAVFGMILYIILGPAIAISQAQPNFIFICCVLVAIVRHDNAAIIFAFIMGLLGGLVGYSAVGLMAIVTVILAFILVTVFTLVDDSTLFMPIAAMVVSFVLAEIAYVFLLKQFGMEVSFVGVVWYRALPCALYDLVLGLLLYPLVNRICRLQEGATKIHVANLR